MKATTTIESVKKSALQYLDVALYVDIKASDIPSLIQDNDTFAQYLYNMDESINRGIDRLVQENVVGTKSFAQESGESDGVSIAGRLSKFDLKEMIDDFASLEYVDYVDDCGTLHTRLPYRTQGTDVIILETLKENCQYVFVYRYQPKHVNFDMPLDEEVEEYNKNVLDIPNDAARLLPYFIYGELFKSDDIEASIYEGMNLFEQKLKALKDSKSDEGMPNISNIFGWYN